MTATGTNASGLKLGFRRFAGQASRLGLAMLVLLAAGLAGFIALVTAMVGIIVAMTAIVIQHVFRGGKTPNRVWSSYSDNGEEMVTIEARPTPQGWTVE